MSDYGQFKDALDHIRSLQEEMARNLECIKCDTTNPPPPSPQNPQALSTVAGEDSFDQTGNIVKAISITKTSSGGTVQIATTSGGPYVLTQQGEVFINSAGENYVLQNVYGISSSDGGTWKWQALVVIL